MRVFGALLHPPFARNDQARIAALTAALLLSPAIATAGDKWTPILPEERGAVASPLSPDAGAEILRWTIRIEDEFSGHSTRSVVRHDIRVKVFNAHGAEQAAPVEIPRRQGVSIKDVAARTVRPDGSIVDLSKDQIFDRMLIKGAGVKVDVKAFAFPSVTPGAILDYRWTEYRYNEDAGYEYLEFQRELPVRRIDIFLRPLPLEGTDFTFQMRSFNMPTPKFAEERGGFLHAVLPPVPARREEPYMPPRLQTTPWAICYYTRDAALDPSEVWKRHAESELRTLGPAMDSDDAIRAMASGIASQGGATSSRCDRLYDWCRTNVQSLSDDRLGLSEMDREKAPKNRTPSDTLKRRRGTDDDILYLFIAMCRSLGIDAKLADAADRGEILFDSSLALPRLLTLHCAAVQAEGGWRFYDPSARWLGPGLLPWRMEDEEVLLLDSEKPEFVRTPLAPPDSTMAVRTAHVRLGADGTAVGSLQSEYSGYFGDSRHEAYDALSPDARGEHFRHNGPMEAKEAAFDSIEVDGADDPTRRIVERATVKIGAYAQPVGDRLIFPLSFFEWKAAPLFPDTRRLNPVYFSYPWAVADTVTFELPNGYEVEALPETMAPVTKGVSRYRNAVAVSTDGRRVLFIRSFSFGEGGIIAFPIEQYPSLKGLFDGLKLRDEATLVLKRKS